MSEGVWDARLGLVCVAKMRGKEWASTGRNIHGACALLPEEALYLVDRGRLLIRLAEGDAWMTAQGAYRLLLPLIPQPAMSNYAVRFDL
jgi:hypothetical protein